MMGGVLYRPVAPGISRKLSQAQRDLRDVQQLLDELGEPPFPLGSQAGRRYAQLQQQMGNLRITISYLQEQVGRHPFDR